MSASRWVDSGGVAAAVGSIQGALAPRGPRCLHIRTSDIWSLTALMAHLGVAPIGLLSIASLQRLIGPPVNCKCLLAEDPIKSRMRLLNVTTREVEEFYEPSIPPYAIFSHTWGPEEITFQDLESLSAFRKPRPASPPPSSLPSSLPPSLPSSLSSLLGSSHGYNAAARPELPLEKSEVRKLMMLANMLTALRGHRDASRFQRQSAYFSPLPPAHEIDDDLQSHRSFSSSTTMTPSSSPPIPPPPPSPPMKPPQPQVHPVEQKAGYAKLNYACTQASKDGHSYIWIDTVCIDRRSSSELSEALNSMFGWYQKAAVCYAYLDDVHFDSYTSGYRTWKDDFSASRWFRRGWTLQELVAPKKLVFYAHGWRLLGTKSSLVKTVEKITGIEEVVLLEPRLVHNASIAQRMSWAAGRETARAEDVAYCLLGLFGVNLPIIYGEGQDKAFLRLQEEIIRRTDDQSIFAWGALGKEDNKSSSRTQRHPNMAPELEDLDFEALSGTMPVLAKSPTDFKGMGKVVVSPASTELASDYAMTNKGLHIKFGLVSANNSATQAQQHYLGVLNCHSEDDPSRRLAILLSQTATANVMVRTRSRMPTVVPVADLEKAEQRDIYIPNTAANQPLAAKAVEEILVLKYPDLVAPGYEVIDVQSKGHAQFNKEFGTLRVGALESAVLYQLAVVTFWNKHLKCGFVLRVIVDGGTKRAWVDQVQPQTIPQPGEVSEDGEDMVKTAKEIWAEPGRVEVITPGGRRSVLVEVTNPEKYQEPEGQEGKGFMLKPTAEIKAFETVTFVEKWERDYMRTVNAKMVRKNKGVLELSMSSLLWQAAQSQDQQS
ncbi:hypothetical protein B0T21DRAFT_384703 [Apiosordaria backusii]|uniref:Heterokaryon incompatibility domain-containing protein n=1 Tax=Apiosordaria backusii TaxID=314023 RepID=A0AA40E8P5_9PEZI|nr:hypothetical protein B0T21DRAFT_384703 [Apiosordaria backusii]